jgi:hypothetical protein
MRFIAVERTAPADRHHPEHEMSATRRVVWAATLLAAALAPGCRRRTTYHDPRTIEGLRFFAASELAGDGADSL